MPTLEQYDAVDITIQIRDARDALKIPERVTLAGVEYRVYPPNRVAVFAEPPHLNGFVVEEWIQTATESLGGHIIPTGGTFEPIYEESVRRKRELAPYLINRLLGNLDEVWPIWEGDPNTPLTYVVYRDERVVKPLGLSPEQCIIPDGRTENPLQEVVIFEGELAGETWDFAMLGIGPDEKIVDGRTIPASAHMGFIPKGTLPSQTAMFVELDYATIYANSRGAPNPDHFFTHAITQGPADIGRAKRHLLVATGTYKKNNIRDVLLGPVDINIPASQLLLYPDTTIVLDTQSAQLILAQIADLPQRHSFPVR